MIGAATSLSSTVLVFKSLAENGQLESPPGRRAIAILLFQDVALVPLMLLIPMLSGEETAGALGITLLAVSAALYLFSVFALRYLVTNYIAPALVQLRSVELVVLFSLTVLGLGIGGAHLAGLPPALGALAAGLVLGGNRLSGQVDAMILPFRESFAAVFFVSLGTLLRPSIFLEQPVLLVAGLIGALAMKTAAAAIALRFTGLNWRVAIGMGLGLAQLGEFSFVLFSEAMQQGLISAADYNRILFIALGTLIATPELLRLGLKSVTAPSGSHDLLEHRAATLGVAAPIALIIGGGRLGRHAAQELRRRGCEVRVVDESPVNLHCFAQEGFQTASGDARSPAVLNRVAVQEVGLVMVFVSQDLASLQITQAIRDKNPAASLLVRCRYQTNVEGLQQAGCDVVICDEIEATQAIERLLPHLSPPIQRPQGGATNAA